MSKRTQRTQSRVNDGVKDFRAGRPPEKRGGNAYMAGYHKARRVEALRQEFVVYGSL